MIWNKPTQYQIEKYQKGCRISKLFQKNIDCDSDIQPSLNCKLYRFEDLENINENMLEKNSPFKEMILTELNVIKEKQINAEEKFRRESEFKSVLKIFFNFQANSTIIFNAFEILEHIKENNKLKLKKISCPEELNPQFSYVKVDQDKCEEICFKTVGQSSSSNWFKERFIRITCSTRAHAAVWPNSSTFGLCPLTLTLFNNSNSILFRSLPGI